MMYLWTGNGKADDMADPKNYEPRGVPKDGDCLEPATVMLAKLIHCITCDIRFPGAESGLAHECPGCKETIWRDVETWRRIGKHGVPAPADDCPPPHIVGE